MAPSVQKAIEFVFKEAQQRKLEDNSDDVLPFIYRYHFKVEILV